MKSSTLAAGRTPPRYTRGAARGRGVGAGTDRRSAAVELVDLPEPGRVVARRRDAAAVEVVGARPHAVVVAAVRAVLRELRRTAGAALDPDAVRAGDPAARAG